MSAVYVIETSRTPIGRAFKGSMVNERPENLAASSVGSLMAKVPEIGPHDTDELILGVGVPGGQQGSNLARVVAVLMGWDSVPAHVVSRYCASSTQAIRSAAHAIMSGEENCVIAAGVESISSMAVTDVDNLANAKSPAFETAMRRTKTNSDNGELWQDPRESNLLPDVYISMGETAENLAGLFGISRQDQDDYALRSQMLSESAFQSGFWSQEIDSYQLRDGSQMTEDESRRPSTSAEGLINLAPVFRENGTVTAGNACPLNDGAASIMLASEDFVSKHGLKPRARILGGETSAISPEIMGQGPVGAIEKLERRLGLSGQVDQYEINEAFAVQVLANIRALDIDVERVNINGGSLAVGHPYGMTGARIAGTLINSLETHDHEIGIEAMCVAGGQGMAIAIERMGT
jgi:acetyl-CoA C-acetyltransferase